MVVQNMFSFFLFLLSTLSLGHESTVKDIHVVYMHTFEP